MAVLPRKEIEQISRPNELRFVRFQPKCCVMQRNTINILDRDVVICQLYESGYAQADIAISFALSGSRVGQILKKNGVPRRSLWIPALEWSGWPDSVPAPADDWPWGALPKQARRVLLDAGINNLQMIRSIARGQLNQILVGSLFDSVETVLNHYDIELHADAVDERMSVRAIELSAVVAGEPVHPRWRDRVERIRLMATAECRELERKHDDEYTRRGIRTFRERLTRDVQVAWSPVFGGLSSDSAGRCHGRLGGPLFTSDTQPWPKGGAHGSAEPIIQLDLADLSVMSGENLGDGLLQLWMRDFDGVIRRIPRNEIAEALLVSPPDQYQSQHLWDIRTGYPIIGYSKPYLFISNNTEDDILNNIGEWGISDSLQRSLNVLLRFARLGRLPIADRKVVLMGSFHGIQYSPEEMGRTLASFESGTHFIWGDSGNAQISFSEDLESLDLEFHRQSR